MPEVSTSVRELAMLQESTQMILSTADLDTVLHQILLMVRNYFEAAHCGVFLLDAATGELYCEAHTGYSREAQGRRYRVGEDGMVGRAAARRELTCVPDVSRDPRCQRSGPDIHSELALPLLAREEVVGVLDVESDQAGFFTDEIISRLLLFSSQAALAIDNTRLYATERRRMRQIELINLIARSAASTPQLEDFVATLAELLSDTFEGADIAILLAEEEGGVGLRARAGTRQPLLDRFTAGQTACLLALHPGASFGAPRPAAPSTAWPGCFAPTTAGHAESEVVIPLHSCGEVLGAIVLAHPQANFFSADDSAIAQTAADVSATAIRNVQLAGELRRVASTDFLTGLDNRRHFHDVLREEIRRGKRYHKNFTIAMVDLRGFRQINAAIGFDGGDELLRRVARGLKSHMRFSDHVCRYEGDQFAMILPETDPQHMGAILEKIHRDLAGIEYGEDKGGRVLTAAVAWAHFPQDGDSEAELVRALLTRLQEQKLPQAAGA